MLDSVLLTILGGIKIGAGTENPLAGDPGGPCEQGTGDGDLELTVHQARILFRDS
jgi:hypothetical protein